MDTSETTSSALDTNQAASLLASLIDPDPVKEKASNDAPPVEPEKVEPEKPEVPETEAEESPEEAPKFTIKIDGKDVELTQAQIAEAYKNGLRQEDYTRKTMATADQRKAAEAEVNQARAERQQYAQGLQQAQAVLTAQLQEQSQIDWQKLLDSDPVEYLKQQHLANARQAQLQQVNGQQQQLHARQQAEQADQMSAYIRTQQDELLAKLPEWKDEGKAKLGREAIREYLVKEGFDAKALDNINDHRAVVLADKAMKYDEMMSKASAAAKKVSNLPQKVMTPGGGESQSMDKRSAEWNRFAKSGKVEDAAAIFSRIL